jgi:3-vinyl bacteriochlorophyllide hydratase
MYQLPKRKTPNKSALSYVGHAAAVNILPIHRDLPVQWKARLAGLSSKPYETRSAERFTVGDILGEKVPAAESEIRARRANSRPLYTPEQRRRRDGSRWTLVQGVLAPLQFGVFLISAGLVIHYLSTGDGLTAATISVVIKTFILYAIMITGSLWEHDVYGQYLFAPAFYWEDVVSMLVIALHTAYLAALVTGTLAAREQMFLALAAYGTYAVNAAQFLLKLRLARLEARAADVAGFGQ